LAIGKIAEAVILDRMETVVDARGILPEFHFEFRKGQSKTQKILSPRGRPEPLILRATGASFSMLRRLLTMA
jgi:hypothetical protein